MAGRANIQAGKAFVELLLKDDKFQKGLRAASVRLQNFGSGMKILGATVAAAGGVITGFATAAVKHFADFGSELNDMSARTGVGATALAELGYAAEQTGASMEDVEGAIRKMQKFLGSSEDASQATKDALKNLGLAFDEIKGKAPDEQFQIISDKVAGIADPSKRAAAAMEIFGKKGTTILPMLEELASLRQEARDLGIAPSEEDVKKADDLGDSLHRIVRAGQAVVFNIGSALADAVQHASGVITRCVATVNKWVKANSAIVKSVAGVGVGLLAAGTAITAFGFAFSGVGKMLGLFANGIGLVKTALAFLLTPFGAITAAIGLGATLWFKYSESGKNALAALKSAFAPIIDTARMTFNGISDAISSGDLGLAGKIAMAGLRVAWLQGLAEIRNDWTAAMGAMSGAWTDFTDALEVVLPGVNNKITDWCAGIQSSFAIMCDGNRNAWQGLMTFMAQSTLVSRGAIAKAFTEFSRLWGNTERQIIGQARVGMGKITEEQHEAHMRARNEWYDQIDANIDEETRNQLAPTLKGSNPAELAKQLKAIEEARRAAQRVPGTPAPPPGAAANPAAVDPRMAAAQANLDAAKKELDELIRKAAEARKAAEDAAEAKRNAAKNAAATETIGTAKTEVFGTFSAAALIAGGGAGDPNAKETARNTAEMKREAKIANKLMRDIINAQKNLVFQ